ncbi:Putative transposase (fragment) [Bradyrhizobium sp. ORS 285]
MSKRVGSSEISFQMTPQTGTPCGLRRMLTLRRFLPRKTDLKSMTPAAIRQRVHRLNHTPRKCLDFQTPAEAFSKLKSTVALQT